jgi:hypothetical protein
MVDSLHRSHSTTRHTGHHHPRSRPGRVKGRKWQLEDVHHHLQYAVDIEMWTIPYYLTVMYSIKDPSEPAFRLIQSVVNQEMLHAQLAANVYNSFQPKEQHQQAPPLHIGPFNYTKEGGVPHLNFALDEEAVDKYGDQDARLGGLDLIRLGTMCLIELPESSPPSVDPSEVEYATIGDFYDALRVGMGQHPHHVHGNHNQVDYFKNFYRNLSHTTVTQDGSVGLDQALKLIDVITEQGEGRTNTNEGIPAEYQNTADGYNTSSSHFQKFNAIRDAFLSGREPATYSIDSNQKDTQPRQALALNFAKLLGSIQDLFNGGSDDGLFGVHMHTVGANILSCWRRGIVPEVSGIVPQSSSTGSMA